MSQNNFGAGELLSGAIGLGLGLTAVFSPEVDLSVGEKLFAPLVLTLGGGMMGLITDVLTGGGYSDMVAFIPNKIAKQVKKVKQKKIENENALKEAFDFDLTKEI